MNFLDYLSAGKENAKTAKELMNMANLDSTRDVSCAIHELRKNGTVICSATGDNAGYYLPANRHEVVDFVGQMHSRLIEIKKAVRSAEEYLTASGLAGIEDETTY